MQFTSQIYQVLKDKKIINVNYHNDGLPHWVYEEGTLYQKQYLYGCGWIRTQLNVSSETQCIYYPIGRIENGVHIGWSTQAANYSNQILKMSPHERSVYFPHLYFVQLGNNPYPSSARLSTTWVTQMWHRECHKILLPHEDPQQFFRTFDQFKSPV